MAYFVIWRSYYRFLSTRKSTTQTVSNLKWKLQQFKESGQLKKLSVREAKRKSDQTKKRSVRSTFREGLSPQKALLLLKSRYDSIIIPDDTGNAMNLNTLNVHDLKVGNSKSLQIFNGLMKVKKVTKRTIDDRIIMILTGVTKESVKDSYFVARDVSYLLHQDNDINRAMEICRLSKAKGAVGINAILEWCLKRSKKDLARKVLVSRGKWGIPLSPATLVTYFSGLSDCHEWGHVSDSLAQEVLKQFESHTDSVSIETFNAALRLLSKNYSSDQAYAWKFFEKLDIIKIRPDAQTFTIFLQGLKSFYKKNVELIQKDPSVSSSDRTKRLFEQQAILISRANLVFEKAKSYAKPPKPPSEQEFNQNQHSFSGYKTKTAIPFLDIDRHLAVAFLSCYCDVAAGTAWSNKSGSHYWYLQQVLAYLQAWTPEVTSIVEFATSQKNLLSDKVVAKQKERKVLIHVKAAVDVRKKTDDRTKKVGIDEEFLPQNVVQEKSITDINPWMLFPLSPFSHGQAKQYATGIERQLVDFARVKANVLEKKYVKSHARHSVKGARVSFPKKSDSSKKRDGQSINKFLLRIFLDCLLRLGLFSEFYKAMWFSISTWSDIKIDLKNLRENKVFQPCAISKDMYPTIDSRSSYLGETGYHQSKAQLEVIDIGLVEDFIHKIGEHLPSSSNPSAFAVEVLAAYSNPSINSERNLRPRPSTFGAIFSMLHKDVHRYNDRNAAIGYQDIARKNLSNYTAKKFLTLKQLDNLLDSLEILIRCILTRFGRKNMEPIFIQSFDNLISKIYSVAWKENGDNNHNALSIHRRIIHCGILMYRPSHLIDKREDKAYSKLIFHSLEFVHNVFNARKDLSREEVNLMMTIRDLFNFEKYREHSESKFETLQMDIYRLTGEMKSARVSS